MKSDFCFSIKNTISDEKLKDNKLLKLYRIKDSDININCPVFYRISLKEEFLK